MATNAMVRAPHERERALRSYAEQEARKAVQYLPAIQASLGQTSTL